MLSVARIAGESYVSLLPMTGPSRGYSHGTKRATRTRMEEREWRLLIHVLHVRITDSPSLSWSWSLVSLACSVVYFLPHAILLFVSVWLQPPMIYLIEPCCERMKQIIYKSEQKTRIMKMMMNGWKNMCFVESKGPSPIMMMIRWWSWLRIIDASFGHRGQKMQEIRSCSPKEVQTRINVLLPAKKWWATTMIVLISTPDSCGCRLYCFLSAANQRLTQRGHQQQEKISLLRDDDHKDHDDQIPWPPWVTFPACSQNPKHLLWARMNQSSVDRVGQSIPLIIVEEIIFPFFISAFFSSDHVMRSKKALIKRGWVWSGWLSASFLTFILFFQSQTKRLSPQVVNRAPTWYSDAFLWHLLGWILWTWPSVYCTTTS